MRKGTTGTMGMRVFLVVFGIVAAFLLIGIGLTSKATGAENPDDKAFEVNKGLNCSEEFQRNQTTATRAYTCLLNCYRCSEENKSYAEDHSDSYSVEGIFSGGFPCYFGGSYINFYGQLVVELTEETGDRPIKEIEAEVKRLSGTDCVLFRTVKHAYSELVDVMTALCLHCKSSEYDAEKLQIYGFEICDEENTVIAYVNSLEEAILESTRKSVGHTDCLKFALQEIPEEETYTLNCGTGIGKTMNNII